MDSPSKRTAVPAAADADSDSPDRVLCVLYRSRKLGFACFERTTCALECGEVAEIDDYAYLDLVKAHTAPRLILASSAQDEEFVDVLRAPLETAANAPPFPVDIVKAGDFSVEAAQHRLSSVRIRGIGFGLSTVDKLVQLQAHIDTSCGVMMRCIGALLAYLQRRNLLGAPASEQDASINSVVQVPIDGALLVDAQSQAALRIFASDAHPAFAGAGKAKESFSLFGVLDRTSSASGRKLLRLWMLRPLTARGVIDERLDSIAFFLQPAHFDLMQELRAAMRGVGEMRSVVLHMQRYTDSPADWRTLNTTVQQALVVRESVRPFTSDARCPSVFRRIVACWADDLDNLATMLEASVDLSDAGRVSIRPGIDAQLDALKSAYNDLDGTLTQVAREEMAVIRETSDAVSQLNVVYFPQIGYLVAVPRASLAAPDAHLAVAYLEQCFDTDEHVYFKTTRMRRLDAELGDIHGIIVETEARLLRQVATLTLEHCCDTLLNVSDLAAELDCLISFAIVSHERKYVRPVLHDGDEIEIVDGRHPLQELCVDLYVPANLHLGGSGGDARVCVVTGPNSSGKSVLITMTALVCYMAHLGCYVPAARARVGRVDRIFTRVRTPESARLRRCSAFVADASQMAAALAHATDKSLVVVDEFGKGTDVHDGMALLAASIRAFVARGARCPRALFATHFYEIIEMQLLPTRSPLLRFMRMEVLLEGSGGGGGGGDASSAADSLVFLYRCVPGTSTAGHGAHCARLAGMPVEIVVRATQVAPRLLANVRIDPVDNATARTQQLRFVDTVARFQDLDVDGNEVGAFLADAFAAAARTVHGGAAR